MAKYKIYIFADHCQNITFHSKLENIFEISFMSLVINEMIITESIKFNNKKKIKTKKKQAYAISL